MQQILWLVPVLSVQLIHRTMPMTSVSWQEKWPYFYFLYNFLLICIPALDIIRETWKIWQWPIRKLMQEKNICWRGRFGAVLGPCFAVEAFQTCTECHGCNDVFQGSLEQHALAGGCPCPVGLLELSAREPTSTLLRQHWPCHLQSFCSSSGNRQNSFSPTALISGRGCDRDFKHLNKTDSGKRSERKMGAWTRAGTPERAWTEARFCA